MLTTFIKLQIYLRYLKNQGRESDHIQAKVMGHSSMRADLQPTIYHDQVLKSGDRRLLSSGLPYPLSFVYSSSLSLISNLQPTFIFL